MSKTHPNGGGPSTASTSYPTKRQLRMGPAPFASFEDLSDELESPEDKQSYVIRLPGIHEDATTPGGSVVDGSDPADDVTSTGISLIGARSTASTATSVSNSNTTAATYELSAPFTGAKLTPCTPRIDISRASSSSHHEDSRDSTPENQDAIPTLGLGFREEGALELRSSTEELDFQDPTQGIPSKASVKSRPASPLVFICDPNFDRQRKDSQTSEICLLSISGRTSRLSSIGSQCSDQSRISTASHLSVMSGQSGASRSTSPHKMLLETSFCGSKPNLSELVQGQSAEPKDGDVLEKVLLARKHDPREAIMAEGITIDTSKTNAIHGNKPVRKSTKTIPKPARANLPKNKPAAPPKVMDKPKDPPPPPIKPPTPAQPIPTISIRDCQNTPPPPELVTYGDKRGEKLIPGQVIKSECGVEYTFIPLKGPLPKDLTKPNSVPTSRRRSREQTNVVTRSSSSQPLRNKSAANSTSTTASGSHSHRGNKEPEYIRIKLKPDYMYNEDGTSKLDNTQKPTSLDLVKTSAVASHSKTKSADVSKIHAYTAPTTVKSAPVSLPSHSPGKQDSPAAPTNNNTSPSLSRRSSLFKSRETISPDCSTPTAGGKRKSNFTTKLKEAGDTLKDRSRSRSKSRERDWSPAMSSNESIDAKMHKQKSSVFSIFKPKKTPTKPKASSAKSSAENLQYEGITNVEFKFDSLNKKPKNKYHEQLLEGDSIRIPLHSPSEYENRTIVKVENDVCEKVVTQPIQQQAVVPKQQSVDKNFVPETPPERSLKHNTSTSSENIVFSTKLGSNEEIFTTKLPKKPTFLEQAKKPKKPQKQDREKVDKVEETVVQMNQPEVKLPPKTQTAEVAPPPPPKPAKVEPVQPPQKIELISQTVITTEKVTKTTPTKTEIITITQKNEIEINHISKVDGSTANRVLVVSDVSNRDSVSTTANEETTDNSENDSEIEFINKKKAQKKLEKQKSDEEVCEDHERKTLVFQTDSFEDELPYIPTTLPLERSVAVPIVPIKQRATFEMKTCPIDRPRSTTPINPSCIDDYCGDFAHARKKNSEKLKISLPREDTIEKIQKLKSPRKTGTNPRAWQEFAEKGIASHQSTPSSGGSHHAPDSGDDMPPPLPPRGTPKEPSKQWINFEEIPEKQKPAKRIQTIPSRSHIDVPESVLAAAAAAAGTGVLAAAGAETVIYNYVNPEDCQCECHEVASKATPVLPPEEAEIPLLQDDDSSDDTMKMSSSSSSHTKR